MNKKIRNINSSNYDEKLINSDLTLALTEIRAIMNNSADLMINDIMLSGHKGAIVTCEGLTDTGISANLIFKPLMNMDLGQNSTSDDVIQHLMNNVLMTYDRTLITTYGDLFRYIMCGFVVVIVDGQSKAISLGVQGFATRSVEEPNSEVNVKGAKDGFVETVRINVSLIRRRLKSPNLKFEAMNVGKVSQTDIFIAYMTDRAPTKLVEKVKMRLKDIKLDTVLSSGYVEPFLQGQPFSLFSGVDSTQRPDVVCAKILEGRVAVMIDNTPFVLVVPTLFAENFQTMDDYSQRPFYGTYIRWLKYFAFFLATMLPGIYVAVVTFHPEMFMHSLLLNLISSKQTTPYSILAEALIITILYEIMREAGIRLPKVVGAAVGIVGGLVIGDAAVTSGLISAPLLIVLGLTATSSFVVSGLNQQTSILRIAFIILGGTLGLYGVALLLGVLIVNICAIETFGVPYTAPIAPFTFKATKDVLVRTGFKTLEKTHTNVTKLNGVTNYNNKSKGK